MCIVFIILYADVGLSFIASMCAFFEVFLAAVFLR